MARARAQPRQDRARDRAARLKGASLQGSLALRNGVLWVARSVRTTRVTAYDLDGRPLAPTVSLRGGEGSRTEIRAIAVDEDRRIWAADAGSGCVRAYNVSGAEVGRVGSLGDPELDRVGALGDAAGIAVQGVEAETELLVSRRGHRRHALFLLAPGARDVRPRSLRPCGDPRETFQNLAGVALAGDRVYACEAGTGAIQVFRGGEFHYRIALPRAGLRGRGAGSEAALEPRLIAPLPDGRLVIACGGGSQSALLVLDANGRHLATLAEEGTAEGRVHLPIGLAVEEGSSGPGTRIAVLDRDADRVQIFTLDGRCYGSFVEREEVDFG